MSVKERFYRIVLIKKKYLILLTVVFFLFIKSYSSANYQEQLIKKYQTIDTLYFDFTQKIGNKTEIGNCYIKYSLLMKCEYPKKNKSIITNGKKLAIVKKRYKKIYYYPLNKTPLFHILNKETILNVIINYKPEIVDTDLIQYELVDDNSNKINILFNKKTLEFLGWKTIDSYSNEVSFLIKNVKINVIAKNEIFKIPRVDDL